MKSDALILHHHIGTGLHVKIKTGRLRQSPARMIRSATICSSGVCRDRLVLLDQLLQNINHILSRITHQNVIF